MAQSWETRYEWDVETHDGHGDIIDHNHGDTAKELVGYYRSQPLDEGTYYRLVLVRDQFFKDGDRERTWAYVENDKLPEVFMDAFGWGQSRVPKRFHQELARAIS